MKWYSRMHPSKYYIGGICFLLLIAVESCGWRGAESIRIERTGIVTVIGNSPFESIALFQEDGTMLRLRGTKELQRKLIALQGTKISVVCSEPREEEKMETSEVFEFSVVDDHQQ